MPDEDDFEFTMIGDSKPKPKDDEIKLPEFSPFGGKKKKAFD